MVPGRPRRPMPPSYPPARIRHPSQARRPAPSKATLLLSHFRDTDGNLDFQKISETVQQVNSIYTQVSPMITKFIKK